MNRNFIMFFLYMPFSCHIPCSMQVRSIPPPQVFKWDSPKYFFTFRLVWWAAFTMWLISTIGN